MRETPLRAKKKGCRYDVRPVLLPGETILWEGAPNPGFRLRGTEILQCIFGLPFLLGGVIALIDGLRFLDEPGNSPLGLAIFVTLFVGLGGYVVFVPLFGAFKTARHVRYALSTQAAYIVRDWPVQRVEVYPILPANAPELQQGRRTDTVWLHTRNEEDAEGDIFKTRIGFQYINNAADVVQLIQTIRTGDAR